MDSDGELQKFKWMVIIFILFVVSGFISYSEMKYAVWGKTAEARITDITESMARSRRGSTPMLTVKYEFVDANGQSQSGRDQVPTGWEFPSQNTTVQYLQSTNVTSRLLGNDKFVFVWIFGAASLALIGALAYLVYEANQPIKKRPHRRSVR